ncbi:Intermediate filament protein ON3 [Channa argus]|uniref:Keratin, type II cytoskeletal 8 n=2 Tax=Channa argus TaxID=215402 RepID=A0A6G1PE35_CHAAH|nr:Intermediate filament protein ON3 [Channa argus]
MVGLNDRFVQVIDKAKHLEDENRKLATKLKILKEQGGYEGNIDPIVRQAETNLQQKIEELLLDQEKLQAELHQMQKQMEDTKKSYQEELEKKDDLEKEFMISKKEADHSHLHKIELQLELEDLVGKLEFLRIGYDEEIKELESQIQNETVILPDLSKRSLDLDDYIETVKNQYNNMAARAREDTEQWYKTKIDNMVEKVEKAEQDVRDTKREISDLMRQIQRLNGDVESLKRKEDALKRDIEISRTNGEENLDKARDEIMKLEEALKRAKQDLVGQIREHQELMNLKLALDMEIGTYRKLLEGEEARINNFMRNTDF